MGREVAMTSDSRGGKRDRTSNTISNVVYSVGYQLLTLVLSFISRTAFIWHFGAAYLGINGLFSDVLSLLSLVDLGFGIAMVYSLYEPLANGDEVRVSALVRFFRDAYLAIAFVVALVGIAITPLVPLLVKLEVEVPHLKLYYLLSLANVVASYLFIYRTTVLTADQRNYVVTRVNMWVAVLRTVLQILSILILNSYVAYLSVAVFTTVIANIFSSRIAVKDYPFIKEGGRLSKDEKRGILGNVFSAFVFKVSNALMNATDNIIISVVVGTVFVGYYSNYLMVSNRLLVFYTLLFSSATASIGNLVVTGTAERRYDVFRKSQAIGFMAAGIMVPCFFGCIDDVITLWAGSDFLMDASALVAMCVNLYLSCVLQPLWTYREATGLYSKTKWVMVGCATLNVILSFLLGNTFGVAGILAASSLSRLVTYFWYEPRLLFSMYFEKSSTHYFLQIASNALLVFCLSAVTRTITSLVPLSIAFLLFVKIPLCFLICLASVSVMYRGEYGIGYLINTIKTRLG